MNPVNEPKVSLMIAGALHADVITLTDYPLQLRASNPIHRAYHLGGVAANAALAAQKVAQDNQIISLAAATGDDLIANQLEHTLQAAGLTTSLQRQSDASTGCYIAVMDHSGELYIGLSDVSLAESLDPQQVVLDNQKIACRALLLDANLSASCLHSLNQRARSLGITTVAMSVSPAKSTRLVNIASSLGLLFCNRREAIALTGSTLPTNTALGTLADALRNVGFSRFVITDSNAPVLVQDHHERHTIAVPASSTTRQHVNGAGDALAGASFAAWCAGTGLAQAIKQVGLPAAGHVVYGRHAAPRL